MAKGEQIDRRWIFLCVAAAIAATLFYPFRQSITPSPSVRSVYEFIQGLPRGSTILIATDFDPSAQAELAPMLDALLEHCFRQDVRVVGMTFWPTGSSMAKQIFGSVAKRYGKVSGTDYVYLGYKPGEAQVIIAMGEKIESAFPRDADDRPTAGMPIFRTVSRLPDLRYLIDLAAGATVDVWIVYGGDKYHVPMGAGCTAVSGPDNYVFLSTGQLNGLIAGLRGAADYEVLLNKPGPGVLGMAAQSTVHGIIVLFVIIGNVAYFRSRRAAKRAQEQSHG